jgi:hypothetical protein
VEYRNREKVPKRPSQEQFLVQRAKYVTSKPLCGVIVDLKWDKKDIVVCTNNGVTNICKVMCFNTDTLDLRWETEKMCNGEGVPLIFNDYAIFCQSVSLEVLRRSDGQCLYKIDSHELGRLVTYWIRISDCGTTVWPLTVCDVLTTHPPKSFKLRPEVQLAK